MVKLGRLAKLVRSKNAKPFLLTIDIMFEDAESYDRVKRSGKISKEKISRIYRVPRRNILLFEDDEGYSYKITFPRPITQGDIGDGDIYGGQQYSPLLDIKIE